MNNNQYDSNKITVRYVRRINKDSSPNSQDQPISQYHYYSYNQTYTNDTYPNQYVPDQGVPYQNNKSPYGYQPYRPDQLYGNQGHYAQPSTYRPYNPDYGYNQNIPQGINYYKRPSNNLNNDMRHLNVNDNQPKKDIDPGMSSIFNKKDIPSINRNNKDVSYWDLNNNKNDNQDLKKVINSIFQKNMNLFDNNQEEKNPDANKIAISNLFHVSKKTELNEEMEDPDVPDIDTIRDGFQNWFNASYIPCKKKNLLDDLQELLRESTKYYDAKNHVVNGKYSDHEFYGVPAIKGFGERNDYSEREMAEFLWLRPEEFFKDQPRVFEKIDPNDILQGGLGDCYFLAAIASIASKPHRLERIFLTKEYNREGIYVVALCINGVWEDVVLDDRFPCKRYSRKIAFNTSKNDELWVMLLEKAWAKIHGGYLNIAAGLTREALRDLTGASAKTFFTAEGKDRLWSVMIESYNKDYVLTAGSDNLNYGSDAYISKIGIAGSHAYSVLGTFEILNVGGRLQMLPYEDRNKYHPSQLERVVKMRNPWGTGEWKGKWSDLCSTWTNTLRDQLGAKIEDDGVFFIDFDNFCKYFSDVQVCYYHDNYKYSSTQITSQRNDRVYLKFTVTKPGLHYFSINQKNRRFFPKDKKYRYSPLSMIIGGIDQFQNVFYVGSGMKQDKENWVEFNAKPGTYYAYIHTPWKSMVNEFSFSVYGPCIADIQQVQPTQLPVKFFTNLLLSHAEEDKETELLTLSGSQVYYKRWDCRTGLGYLYFENRDPSMTADITVELSNCRNIKLLAPFKGLRPNVSIKPGETKIIGYEPTGTPSSCEMRIISSMKATGQKKEDLVKNEGLKMNRFYYGKDVGIYVYALYSMDGAIYKYVNTSSLYTLSEEIEFELSDCYIEGNIGNYIEFVLGPGEEKVINIHKDDYKNTFNAKVKHIDYEITYSN